MNKVVLCGRLTKDPVVSYTAAGNCVAKYTLAVDRRTRQEGAQEADFISCVAFGRSGEFVEKYLKQGTKILAVGRIQTGSYTNREGQRVYTTDVIVEEHEFVEKKADAPVAKKEDVQPVQDDQGFMVLPDDLEDEGLPFN